MKYLLISALLFLLVLLVYARLKPYLRLIRQIINMLDTSGKGPGPKVSAPDQISPQLVCCAGCKTWIPVDRAIGNRTGLPPYCSTECLEKSAKKKQKLAG